MKKTYLWIADFQFESETGVKAYSACVDGRNIAEALEAAEGKAYSFMAEFNAGKGGFRVFVTNVGLADVDSDKYPWQVWPDPINDPDPELFR